MKKFVYPEMKITEIDEKSFLLTTSGLCDDEDCEDDECYEVSSCR